MGLAQGRTTGLPQGRAAGTCREDVPRGRAAGTCRGDGPQGRAAGTFRRTPARERRSLEPLPGCREGREGATPRAGCDLHPQTVSGPGWPQTTCQYMRSGQIAEPVISARNDGRLCVSRPRLIICGLGCRLP